MDEAFDAEGVPVRVAPDTDVFACAGTLCMGFSWSHYFCHAVLVRAMLLAAQTAFGTAPSVAALQLVVDRRLASSLGPGRPSVFPYVDNGNALCWCQSDRERLGGGFPVYIAVLGLLGFSCGTDGGYAWAIVGFVFDAGRRWLGPRPERA